MLISNYTVEFTLLVILLVAVASLMAGVTWNFETRTARLPEATRYENLADRLRGLNSEIEDQNDKLKQLRREVQERDQVAAEIAALAAQRDNLHAEIAALADAERQIDEVKRRAADAAVEAAEIQAKVDEAQLELERTAARAIQLEREISSHEEKLRALTALPEDIQQHINELNARKQSLSDELDVLRSERGQLFAAREEVAQLHARKDSIERDIADRQPQSEALQQRLQQISEEVTARQDQLSTIAAEITSLQRERREVAELTARKAALEIEIEHLEEKTGVRPEEGAGSTDLQDLPLCLTLPSSGERMAQKEQEALYDVRQTLRDQGLRYNDRIIDAFHTSLKINDFAQLSVLAGVSGTGKSLLPRVYAQSMGLSFLPIAVEPRWDSPQDLLGFYNYVEKRYRGTELARALVQMDPFNTSGLGDHQFDDRMMLVLLDEMNLARVEYYFSEFLSRLEIRPRWKKVQQDEVGRQRASISLDTRGAQGGTLRLFPSHNVLFVGTMNDDETTQALSDKVLDRSNVLQFPAPSEFGKPGGAGVQPSVATSPGHRSHAQWRKWIGGIDELGVADDAKARNVIGTLSGIMRDCGRPFGHRLNEAMLTYVANYPFENPGQRRVSEALADQVEMRILPKLRGVMLEEGEAEMALRRLAKLLRDDLQDSIFANRLDKVLDQGGQFNWRGMDRGAS